MTNDFISEVNQVLKDEFSVGHRVSQVLFNEATGNTIVTVTIGCTSFLMITQASEFTPKEVATLVWVKLQARNLQERVARQARKEGSDTLMQAVFDIVRDNFTRTAK